MGVLWLSNSEREQDPEAGRRRPSSTRLISIGSAVNTTPTENVYNTINNRLAACLEGIRYHMTVSDGVST